MSQNIWTRCEGKSNLRLYRASLWRVVEGQHVISTRKLVDSDAEHALLEELLETSKPPLPTELDRGASGERTSGRSLHYLLFTPFRYPPLRHGSRFGSHKERGIWYGAEALRTAFAEVAYYRLLFWQGTSADLGAVTVELSSFVVEVESARAVDLTQPPFAKFTASISSKVSYIDAQALGAAMRGDGVALFRYFSARDEVEGICVGLFTPSAFRHDLKEQPLNWLCVTSARKVEISQKSFFRDRDSILFERQQFEVDGRLPSPGLS